MAHWRPQLANGDGPVYERLLHALERDVRAEHLRPGDRLPPHRDLAHSLSVSVGTVSRAYVEAERRGLISSHVGRGSFVAQSAVPGQPEPDNAIIDMAQNAPPLAPSERWMSEGLARLRLRADLADCVNYAPPEGLPAVRHAGASWLQRRHGLVRASADRIIQCNGGQHGLALAFSALARPGDTILCEAATYAGIKTLAGHSGYRLHGVAMDQGGIAPEAIARAARDTGARVLVVIPTLQNPTTVTLDAGRRAEIANVARKHDLLIVEDEAYRAFAHENAPASLAELAPERTLMVAGVSKAIAPGLRLGFLVPPEDDTIRNRLLVGLRALGYSPPTINALLFSQWEQDGTADRIADDVVAEADIRTRLAQDILGNALAAPGAGRSLHLWLPMPMIAAERFTAQALRAGVALTPPDGPAVTADAPSGVRLCLGGVRNRDTLERALRCLHGLLQPGSGDSALGLV